MYEWTMFPASLIFHVSGAILRRSASLKCIISCIVICNLMSILSIREHMVSLGLRNWSYKWSAPEVNSKKNLKGFTVVFPSKVRALGDCLAIQAINQYLGSIQTFIEICLRLCCAGRPLLLRSRRKYVIQNCLVWLVVSSVTAVVSVDSLLIHRCLPSWCPHQTNEFQQVSSPPKPSGDPFNAAVFVSVATKTCDRRRTG